MSKLQVAIIAGLIAMVVVILGLAAIGHYAQQTGQVETAAPEPDLEDMTVGQILDKLARTANGMKGEKVAANVVVKGARVKDDRRLTYYYTITNVVGGQVDTTAVNEIAKELKRKVCEDRISRTAIDGGGLIVYDYRDKSGNPVASIRVDRGACAAFG